MAAVIKSWKRWMAVGCNHSTLADPFALASVLEFKKQWKPHRMMHLGDFCDFAALRSGAKATKDESEPIGPDIGAGLEFLEALEPTDIFDGNHEDRVFKLCDHPNAIISYCASNLRNEIEEFARKMRARRYEYDIDEGWLSLGGTLFGHGYMYNVNAIRDHAELLGNCVFAHLHRTGQEQARVRTGATGWGLGFLGDKKKFKYAKTHRQRAAWTQGLGYGYYNDHHCLVNILQNKTPGQPWQLPL